MITKILCQALLKSLHVFSHSVLLPYNEGGGLKKLSSEFK